MNKNSSIKIHGMANSFARKTGVEIPEEVLDFYSSHEDKNIDFEFIRLFKDQYESIKKGENPYLSVLISERFALEILKLIYDIPEKERVKTLFDKISSHPFNEVSENIYLKNNKLYKKVDNTPIEEDVEDFILDEILYSVNDYDFRNNKFNFSLVQKTYENLSSDINDIKVILILWVHCGGEGGIIVRGKNTGYNAGYAHLDDSEVIFNGKTIKYRGYIYDESEKPYIEIDKKKLKEKDILATNKNKLWSKIKLWLQK